MLELPAELLDNRTDCLEPVRMTCHCMRSVSEELVTTLDFGRHAPHGAERKPGPQREHGRSDQHGKPEDPDPQGPDGQAVKVAAADNHQGRARRCHDDERC